MDPRYTLHQLPLDLADDDPRWSQILNAVRHGFHDGEATEDAVERFRQYVREDQQRFRYLTCSDTPLGSEVPVATFASWDGQINVGHGRVMPANFISDVTVRPSHRRRGLLRHLMVTELAATQQRGQAFAALTVSEGGIYGRFGFGAALMRARLEIDPHQWHLRRPSSGRVEFMAGKDLDAICDHWRDAMLTHFRGAHQAPSFYRDIDTGAFNFDEGCKGNKKFRVCVHYDQRGEIDGFVVFQMTPWGEVSPTVEANAPVTTDPRVAIELLDALVTMDLISKVSVSDVNQMMSVPHALTNPRAVKVTQYSDFTWLRVVDPIAALSQRGWDSEGQIRLGVTDPLGYAEGVFEITVGDERVEVTRTDQAAQVSTDVEALGSMYLGQISPVSLAGAGRISGDVPALTRLLTVTDPICNLVGF